MPRTVEPIALTSSPGIARPELRALTDREREVLELIARGLSNDDIVAHLVVSLATVKTQVNRILTKLDLQSRAQAVVTAYESGLVRPGDAEAPPLRTRGH